ncbi:MAG: hypothetical protein R3D69_12510 [Xanthobacteraceae bacterium]
MLVRRFVAAADAGPYAERRRFEMRHQIGDDGQAGQQLGEIQALITIPSELKRTPSPRGWRSE